MTHGNEPGGVDGATPGSNFYDVLLQWVKTRPKNDGYKAILVVVIVGTLWRFGLPVLLAWAVPRNVFARGVPAAETNNNGLKLVCTGEVARLPTMTVPRTILLCGHVYNMRSGQSAYIDTENDRHEHNLHRLSVDGNTFQRTNHHVGLKEQDIGRTFTLQIFYLKIQLKYPRVDRVHLCHPVAI